MKYLYSWLKELYPETPPLETLEPLLIQLGHDIESIEPRTYSGVRVAQIITIEKHPNGDNLTLVTVNDGANEIDVVCGAPNLVVGQKVAYAPVGTTLASGLTIAPIKIRGVASNGMLCAEDELGIGQSHAELLPLPAEAITGQPITGYVPPDAIISIDVTSNRGDVLSHFGLARDIKAGHAEAFLRRNLRQPTYTPSPATQPSIDTLHPDVAAFSLGVAKLSSHALRSLSTPLYITSRLRLLGQKPISFVTDLTNYLLLEHGQPLHAYDAESLGVTSEFAVRRARQHEPFTGLNGVRYELTPQSLVVTSNDMPVALAGVLGGDYGKSKNDSQTIILECATFHPKPIQFMARGLNLLTESAQRFARGVDAELRLALLEHTLALWQEFTGGDIYQPISKNNPPPSQSEPCEINLDRLASSMGLTPDAPAIINALQALGITLEVTGGGKTMATAPTWRYDLHLPEDYAEELLRLHNLQDIPKTALPASVPQWKRSKYWKVEWLKDLLVANGCYEIESYPFVSEIESTRWGKTDSLAQLTVPPVGNNTFMRTSLIPGLLTAIAANPDTPQLNLFEIAKIYSAKDEILMVGISASGSNQVDTEQWWQIFFERLRLPVASWMSRVQTLSSKEREQYKIRKPIVMLLELSVEELIGSRAPDMPQVTIPEVDAIHYTPLAKHQASRRDIAFIVNTTHTSDTLQAAITQSNPHIVAVELFDTYTDSKLGEGRQSLAYHIYYQSPEKTLTSDEIQEQHHQLEIFLQEQYHAIIR